jgi:putative endonuclease
MDKTKNKATGNYGEDLACDYLIKQKYKILGRNIIYPFGEIDILAEDKRAIVIIEVKTVWGAGWGSAVELVRRKKEKKLRLLARAVEKDYPEKDIRIDIIGIDSGKLTHIKSAVEG